MISEFWIALYIVVIASLAGYEVITRVPVMLHTPLLAVSG